MKLFDMNERHIPVVYLIDYFGLHYLNLDGKTHTQLEIFVKFCLKVFDAIEHTQPQIGFDLDNLKKEAIA